LRDNVLHALFYSRCSGLAARMPLLTMLIFTTGLKQDVYLDILSFKVTRTTGYAPGLNE
jgi:hypothetical protein